MSEQEKKFDLGIIFEDLTPQTAADILRSLLEGDLHLWMNLAEDFPHPPTALINLVKKAEAKFFQNMAPATVEERTLFLAGALPPSARVIEIALFIANDPDSLKSFEEYAKPMRENRQKQAFDTTALILKAKVHDIIQ